MERISMKTFSCITMILISLQTFAESTISVTVKTNEQTAAGIGFSVAGKSAGFVGKSYTGKGPKNQKYTFGFRKGTIKGTDISCGTLTLTQDSTVTLITKGDQCLSIVN